MSASRTTPLQSLRAQLEGAQSATAVARRIGISRETLRALERGTSRPDPMTAEKIARFYSNVLGSIYVRLSADEVAHWCGGYATRGQKR